MPGIFAQRLKTARIQNGLTQEELGGKLGITKQAVSKYERGKMEPDSQVLIALSRILQVKPDYFFRPFRVSLEEVEFRKRAALSGRKLEGIKSRIADKLERYLELEEHLNIKTAFENPLSGQKMEQPEDLELAAEFLHKHWQLGFNPIPNVVEMLEDAEVKVVEVEVDGKFDGLSTFVSGQIPVIVLNKSFDPLRKRFTALHELGHLLLGLPPDADKEKWCNRFAGAMLMPAPVFRAELGERRVHIDLNELIAIKEYYGISAQAIMYRAKELGVINEAASRRFWQFVNSDPEHKKEAGWGQYPGKETSSRFSQLLFRAVAQETVSIAKAAALDNVSVSEFRNKLQLVS
ncbi:MAG: ImmA/IrrE family metallo-endopeptidase [Lewinellaceae bacterium]|nr:ImmA/IrrE family metallo-endopeptidase [Lewinellaceae bacterium]